VLNFVLRLVARLPLRLVHGFAVIVGWFAWQIGGERKRLSRLNVDLCFPELSATERRRLVYRSFGHYYKTLFEYPLIYLGDADRLRALTVEVRGQQLLDQALAEGKGVILAAMHLGSFEVGAIPMSERYTMTGLFKPVKYAAISDLALKGRTRFGGQVVPIVKRNGKRAVGSQLLRALKRGEIIYAVPDRDPPRGQGVFAPFFGIAAHSPVLIPKLVQATGARVLICYGERLPGARGFVMHFVEPPAGYDSDDLQTAAAAINAGTEACVRAHPEQYWWGYMRFKRRPEGEASFYRTAVRQAAPAATEPEDDEREAA
jgi:KDO2-lipid IV(A) lauroyltransferase